MYLYSLWIQLLIILSTIPKADWISADCLTHKKLNVWWIEDIHSNIVWRITQQPSNIIVAFVGPVHYSRSIFINLYFPCGNWNHLRGVDLAIIDPKQQMKCWIQLCCVWNRHYICSIDPWMDYFELYLGIVVCLIGSFNYIFTTKKIDQYTVDFGPLSNEYS